MATEKINLEVQGRDELGSSAARTLRRQGLIPGVIYGRGSTPTPIAIPERELRRALTGEHGLHAILDVTVDGQGKPRTSILKDYQRDVLRGTVTHVDFQEVSLTETIHASVAVEPVGESAGVKQGGVLTLFLRDVQVEARPLEVPDRIEVDVTDLGIGSTVRVADLRVPAGVTLLSDPEELILTVSAPGRGAAEELEAEEAAAAEGEEPTAEAEPAAEPAGE